MKPSEEELRSFLTRKLGDEVASLLDPASLHYMLDNDLYNEQLLEGVRPEDLKIPPFTKGVRNQLVQAFKTAGEGVPLAKVTHLSVSGQNTTISLRSSCSCTICMPSFQGAGLVYLLSSAASVASVGVLFVLAAHKFPRLCHYAARSKDIPKNFLVFAQFLLHSFRQQHQ